MISLLVFAVLLSACLSFQPKRLGSVSRFVLEKRVHPSSTMTNPMKSMQLFKIKKETEGDDYFESEVTNY
jgi:hypothetical protein